MRIVGLSCVGLVVLGSVLTAEVLTEDTVWSGSVLVEETLEIPAGLTLTVEAGTTVSLKDSVSLLVSGRLLAPGTEASPIRFTRDGGSGTWDRIMFLGADDSLLDYCIIEYSDCAGDHKDYYDTRDGDCNPLAERPPRDYNEAVVVIACHVDMNECTFQNLPDGGGNAQGDAIAVISDDIEYPGDATANIISCQFLSIGQGVHTRYSYVLVEDCYFTGHHGDNDDVDLYGESDPPPMIRNNLMINPGHDDMINPTRCSAILEGNVIAGCDDHGIVLRDKCSPVLINNLIYDCSSAGIAVQNQCDALLINNTIVDCGRGIRFFDHTGRWGLPYCLFPGSGKATVINCIIWDCSTSFTLADSPWEGDPGSHVAIMHSIVQGGEGGMSVSADSTVTWGPGNSSEDPLFVDAAAGDFHLQEGSPAIDAGTADQAPAVDFEGTSRPCGAGIDIGAYESGDCSPVVGAFRRGDPNEDGGIDISDAVSLLIYLFGDGRVPSCLKSGDTNDDGAISIADAIVILAYLFGENETLPAPGMSCGTDPTPDELTCETYAACR